MPKVKYLLLVPLSYNDGSEVPHEILQFIEEDLFRLAGGYTVAGKMKGAYRMHDGSKQVDETVQYWVVVEPSDEAELRSMVGKFGSLLQQESMYLERANSVVEFVVASSSQPQL